MKKLLPLLLTFTGILLAGKVWDADGHQWWIHVQMLASDEMQGRGTGTSGFDRAADYVAQQFQEAGLRPEGQNNYFQPVEFMQLTLDESESSLQLVRSGSSSSVALGDDAILAVTPDTAADLTAPLVFVGYGLTIPEANWNDLDGQNLKGAIAVFLRGGPAAIPGNLRAHFSSAEERWKALKAAGAVGMISLANPKDMETPWSRISGSRLIPKMVLKDPSVQETAGLQFSAAWNPARTEMLFQGSEHSFADVLAASNRNAPLPHCPLAARLQAKTAFKKQAVPSENVVGIRWGTDPKLSHEFVVISAHLDHLGIGRIGETDNIYNGAMDDASGIASIIEIAKELRHRKIQTSRSLIFLALTAEEKGELGSRYYASHPAVEGRYVADINLDMFLPLFPLKYLEVQGLTESTLGDDIRAICSDASVEVQPDKEPNKNRFIRSDQYSFIKLGVPALAFKFGYVPGTPEEKTFQTWYHDRYHGVTDDTTQPVDTAAAAQFDDLLAKLIVRIANAPAAPAWKAGSFFRRFTMETTSGLASPSSGR